MTKKQKTAFIAKLAKAVEKYAGDYGIKCHSIPIAQGILESGWGESRLAKDYNNLFGLKAGTLWKGKSVNMETQEEFEPGTMTTITDNFRAYDSFEEGVKGYFEFLGLKRYQNLKGITDPKDYAETIKADGYATDSKYVISLMSLVEEWNLTQYDPKPGEAKETVAEEKDVVVINPDKDVVVIDPDAGKETKKAEDTDGRTIEDLLSVAKGWLGYSEANGKYREILDVYNSQARLPRGYKMPEGVAWCATFVSACAIKAGMTDLIPTECSCEEMVKLFQKKGRWEEDGSILPEPGWICFYDWDGVDSWSDHVGIVTKVDNGLITVLEGNNGGRVAYRTVPRGWRFIRGFGIVKLGKGEEKKKVEEATAAPRTLSKTEKWVGRVTASALNVRSWGTIDAAPIRSWPLLYKGNLISICDSVKDSHGDVWWYVKIADKYYGFVHSAYVERT